MVWVMKTVASRQNCSAGVGEVHACYVRRPVGYLDSATQFRIRHIGAIGIGFRVYQAP